MGVSTNGILFYGYCYEEEKDLMESLGGVYSDWVEVILDKRGIPSPMAVYAYPYEGSPLEQQIWRDEHNDALTAHYDAYCKIEEEFGCEILNHCSDQCAMPYICVSASMVTARRGYPQVIPPDKLAVIAGWDSMLERFVTEVGLEKPEGQDKPQWWLTSLWG